MALLDVTDILLDPDFMDTGLVCERLTQVVDEFGMASNVTRLFKFSGVVTNDSGDILERLSAGERIKGTITIHSKFRLSDGSEGKTADIVQWAGLRYTVQNVYNWSHFGQGFVAASCDLIKFSG